MKIRLIILNFFQLFVWGAWLITIGIYCQEARNWTPAQFGMIFSTMGIASLFMPALTGMIADRWVNAERLYGVMHILYGITLFIIPRLETPESFFCGILVAMIFYMPTIALANSIGYTVLKNAGGDVVKEYPPIRVFGTVGFIVAMWVTNLTGNNASANQFYIASAFAVLLGLYAFTMPKCPPLGRSAARKSLVQILGFDAFALFKNKTMAIFFIFSMCLGAALQLTNAYGGMFLNSFAGAYGADNPVVRYSTLIMSISQISETCFILVIPFVLRRFGIKNVMLISMFAWVLRFGLFGYGNPDPSGGLWLIILSCIVYGMAFDFFNISGSLFIETSTTPQIRSSAQGLFMMMTNGIGAMLGSSISGFVIQRYFTITNAGGHGIIINWHATWLAFAGYALVVAVLFALLFKYKHTAAVPSGVRHS